MLDMHQAILDTRDTIVRRGHAKHALVDAHGRVCLLGAFNVAATGDPLAWPESGAYGRFAEALDLDDPTAVPALYLGKLMGWNNAPERTVEEVLDRLDRAAAKLAPEEEAPEVEQRELVPA